MTSSSALSHRPVLSGEWIGPLVLDWYHGNGRRLPWRTTKDPYRIWVSEIMLQQTRVTTALAFYEQFIHTFPSVRDLAEADQHAVLKQWEGMGYYARARNLHRSAQLIMIRHGGMVPQRMEDLLSLPGIGRSTAGAILTFAYGERAPILDGNIRRLLCRLYALQAGPTQPEAAHLLWQLAETILPDQETGPFNQGLMDIGALLCLPKKPHCRECPLSSLCRAFLMGLQDRIPPPKKRPPLPCHNRAVGIIWSDGRLLIRLRSSDGLLGGLWEFPSLRTKDIQRPFQMLPEWLRQEYGLPVKLEEEVLCFLHTYTHFQEMIRVISGRCQNGRGKLSQDLRWVWPQELEEYAMPASDRRIAEMLNEQTWGKRQ